MIFTGTSYADYGHIARQMEQAEQFMRERMWLDRFAKLALRPPKKILPTMNRVWCRIVRVIFQPCWSARRWRSVT